MAPSSFAFLNLKRPPITSSTCVVRRCATDAHCISPGTRRSIKTYTKKAAAFLGDCDPQIRISGGNRVSRILKSWPAECPLIDKLPSDDYPELRECTVDGLSFFTKPGIYGWNKIDAGSRMLASLLPDLDGCRVLDLGCGYGYLSICAHQKGATEVVATDSDVRAIAACRRNFDKYGITGSVIPSDCGNELQGPFDFILCNPPFHQGFSSGVNVSNRFFAAMHRLLSPDGLCMMVSNAFLPYEKRIRGVFGNCAVSKEADGFKVLRLAK